VRPNGEVGLIFGFAESLIREGEGVSRLGEISYASRPSRIILSTKSCHFARSTRL
jgi:hypothetical protein